MEEHEHQCRLRKLLHNLKSLRKRPQRPQELPPSALGPATAYGGRTGAWASVEATRRNQRSY